MNFAVFSDRSCDLPEWWQEALLKIWQRQWKCECRHNIVTKDRHWTTVLFAQSSLHLTAIPATPVCLQHYLCKNDELCPAAALQDLYYLRSGPRLFLLSSATKHLSLLAEFRGKSHMQHTLSQTWAVCGSRAVSGPFVRPWPARVRVIANKQIDLGDPHVVENGIAAEA